MNPFNKPTTDLKKEDIYALKDRELAESLFIEYKKDVPQNLGKHIAAFANTQGGWLFLGIEADKTRNIPVAFSGISKADWSSDRIMDTIKGSFDSMPMVHLHSIELDDKQVIITLNIEESPSPPHIFKDSRIYVRNPMSSDPIAEDDRHAVHEMYKKAERAATGLETALEMTLWRTQFKPEKPHEPTPGGLLPILHLSMIVCPKIIRPNLIQVFNELEFLRRYGFIHGGSIKYQQRSIIMEDNVGNSQYFTEISGSSSFLVHEK